MYIYIIQYNTNTILNIINDRFLVVEIYIICNIYNILFTTFYIVYYMYSINEYTRIISTTTHGFPSAKCKSG